MTKKHKNRESGYLLLETLIAIVFLSVVVISIVTTLNFMIRRQQRTRFDSQASVLFQEGLEVAYNALMSEWTNYLPDVDYYPSRFEYEPGQYQWILEPGTEPALEGKYSRTLKINQVCRDSGGGRGPCDAVHSIDPNSREIEVQIVWQDAGQPKKLTGSLLLIRQLAYH